MSKKHKSELEQLRQSNIALRKSLIRTNAMTSSAADTRTSEQPSLHQIIIDLERVRSDLNRRHSVNHPLAVESLKLSGYADLLASVALCVSRYLQSLESDQGNQTQDHPL